MTLKGQNREVIGLISINYLKKDKNGKIIGRAIAVGDKAQAIYVKETVQLRANEVKEHVLSAVRHAVTNRHQNN